MSLSARLQSLVVALSLLTSAGVAHADSASFGGFELSGQINLTSTGISFTNPQTLTYGTQVYSSLEGSAVNLSSITFASPGSALFTLSNGVNFVFYSLTPINDPVCTIGQFDNGTSCSLFYASSPFNVQLQDNGVTFIGFQGTGDAYVGSPAGGLSLVNFGLNATVSGSVDDLIAAASSPQGVSLGENPLIFNVLEGQAPPISTTPEPSSLVLLGTGLLSLTRIRRR